MCLNRKVEASFVVDSWRPFYATSAGRTLAVKSHFPNLCPISNFQAVLADIKDLVIALLPPSFFVRCIVFSTGEMNADFLLYIKYMVYINLSIHSNYSFDRISSLESISKYPPSIYWCLSDNWLSGRNGHSHLITQHGFDVLTDLLFMAFQHRQYFSRKEGYERYDIQKALSYHLLLFARLYS